MTARMKRIGILSSSRADFSIYEPLIRGLNALSNCHVEIIAFGTHLSPEHGMTVESIKANGFSIAHALERCFSETDSPLGVSQAMGRTLEAFANFWSRERFDLVFCLGDRYEMLAAVLAGKPFNQVFAHLYGGETTLGAMDEAFRHSLTHLSQWHFTATQAYAHRVAELTHEPDRIFPCGHLSIDNLSQLPYLSTEQLAERCQLNLAEPTLLVTLHPETARYQQTAEFTDELCAALEELQEYQILLTMPNSDTHGQQIRERVLALSQHRPGMVCVENLGTLGYASAMKHCRAMLGNTSSGFVEASYFAKPVINLGQRQEGRLMTPNIVNCDFNRDQIARTVRTHGTQIFDPADSAVYGQGQSCHCIIETLETRIFPTLQP